MRKEFLGEEKLLAQNEIGFPKGITQVCENVYFFLGYGGSTCTLVVGETSCLLIDCLNSVEVATEALEEMKKITDKPIKNIIYTHYTHFDHTAGSSVFLEHSPEIYGHKMQIPIYKYTHLIGDISKVRGAKQFGVGLSPEEIISVGIGPRNQTYATQHNTPCTIFLENDVEKLDLEGISVEIVFAPGETDDQVFVYLPKEKVLCCGDNHYESFPNLYAVRGSQPRDVGGWIDALSNMISYNAEILLPGHTRAVMGQATVKETLTNYRDALDFVLMETLKAMNQGKTPEQLVEEIKLPEHLIDLPYLQEYYGTVAWSVRAIFTNYLGWFDGNPTHLGHLPSEEKAKKTLQMMGGVEKIVEEISRATEQEEEQWALELCDILLDAGEDFVKTIKADLLETVGRLQTSANGRHFYFSTAKQLRGEFTFRPPTEKSAKLGSI